ASYAKPKGGMSGDGAVRSTQQYDPEGGAVQSLVASVAPPFNGGISHAGFRGSGVFCQWCESFRCRISRGSGRRALERRYRFEDPAAVAERGNANLFQVLIAQLRQKSEINIVLS